MKNWIYVLGLVLAGSGCAKLQPNSENQATTANQAGGGATTLGTATAPSFTPAAGTFAATQNVTLSSATGGVIICYAVNPAQPACNATKTGCTSGTLYGTPVSVSATSTLNAIACKASYNDSTVTTAAYTIDSTAPSLPTGFGGTPISTSQIDLNWTASTDNLTAQANLTYEICQSTTSGGCGTFTLSYTSTSGATAHSVTGLAANTTYYFVIRAKDGVGNTTSGTAQITVTTAAAGSVNAPTFSPAAGTYGGTQSVTITSTTGAATICYTTTGTTPACNAPKTGCTTGTLYVSAVSVSTSQTLKAIACKATFTDSIVTSAAYVIDTTPPGNVTGVIATPANTQISLSWTNPVDADFGGVKILRKTTGYPANSSDGTVVFNSVGTAVTDTGLSNGTLYYYKLFAYDTLNNTATGVQSSATPVAVGVSAPTFSPIAGTYYSAQSVTISSSTGGAILCYTTDGSNPACNSTPSCTTGTLFSTGINLTTNVTLKAIGCKAGYTNSSQTSGSYTVYAPVDNHNGSIYIPNINMTIAKCSQSTTSGINMYSAIGDNCTGGSGLGIFNFCSANDSSCDNGSYLNGTGSSSVYTTCANLNLNGVSWAVPGYGLLQIIYSVYAANPAMFPQTGNTSYWSNTPQSTTFGYRVSFVDGTGSSGNKTSPLPVRCYHNGP